MSAELRAQMGLAATNAAKAVGYVGAGTVEFIFDAETDEYFFMEVCNDSSLHDLIDAYSVALPLY